ncbi:MAG: MurR/RpiR family transcriptional regulator [Firmicutes bacterium]|nr:MurR/RpiR family transcriptional regulator [Bacillota bacterium]
MGKYERYEKEFLQKLTENNHRFTKDHIAIAEYLKKNYKKVSYMKLNELSEVLKMDSNVIKEYLNLIGFNDYEEFRKSLREIVTVKLKTTDRFQISMEINPKISSILNLVVNKEMQNMNHFLNTFDERTFSTIIEEIMDAPEIIVVGTRASSPVAIYAEYIFNRIGKKTKKIISGGSENFDYLSTVDRNALVMAFGFARYPKETIKILGFFRKRNFRIISITDNNLSPLARLSDIVLTIPCESISFTDFFAVPMSVVNILVISVSQLDEETSLKHLNEFENIAKDMGFYF